MRALTIRLLLALVLAASPALAGSDDYAHVEGNVEKHLDEHGTLALRLWDIAEVGYQEHESSKLLQAALLKAGFTIEEGVTGMPTAFLAEYGEGEPVVAMLAEFDALPGMSQRAEPTRQPRVDGAAGHACGHHLFGAGTVAAAVAVKDWLETTGTPGTLRVYGTPAEEGGAAKAYMARDGLFEDADIALHWHPFDRNEVSFKTSLANRSAKFRFVGAPAHAAHSPEKGRSALDGVEAMNFMVNMLREHVPQETRIHYVITDGGDAPNIVPGEAEVFYYVRHPEPSELKKIWTRVVAASEGAARGTGTKVNHEIIHGVNSLLPNEALSRRAHANLERIGGVEYDAEELAFALELAKSLADPSRAIGSEKEIRPFELELTSSSTDVGDVSWVVPTTGVRTATWVPGTPPHSWQAVAAGGTSIGIKGMGQAAKALAATAVDIFLDDELVAEAKAEHARRRKGKPYESLIGDRSPPLDYRG